MSHGYRSEDGASWSYDDMAIDDQAIQMAKSATFWHPTPYIVW